MRNATFYLPGAVFLVATSPALAQTTNCSWMGQIWTCNGGQPQARSDPNIILQGTQDLIRQSNEAQREYWQRLQAQQQAKEQARQQALAAAQQAAVQEQREAVEAAIKSALASDNAPAAPAPTDEHPVLLACTLNNQPVSAALYEKHNRVDVTSGGVTHTRMATFTTSAVTWTSPLFRVSLSRLDGSYVAYGNIPEIEGRSITGSCSVVTQRKF